jgi:hypothetical protein
MTKPAPYPLLVALLFLLAACGDRPGDTQASAQGSPGATAVDQDSPEGEIDALLLDLHAHQQMHLEREGAYAGDFASLRGMGYEVPWFPAPYEDISIVHATRRSYCAEITANDGQHARHITESGSPRPGECPST